MFPYSRTLILAPRMGAPVSDRVMVPRIRPGCACMVRLMFAVVAPALTVTCVPTGTIRWPAYTWLTIPLSALYARSLYVPGGSRESV